MAAVEAPLETVEAGIKVRKRTHHFPGNTPQTIPMILKVFLGG